MRHVTAVALQNAFYAVGVLVGVVTILYFARVWLVPLALAVLLAFVLSPVVGWLERRRLPRLLAVALAALSALLLIGAVGWLVTEQLGSLATQCRENGELYKENLTAKLSPVIDLLQSAQQIEDVRQKGLAGAAKGQATPATPPPTPVVVESEGFSALSWLPSVVWPVLDIGARALLVVVLAIFVLARREGLRDRLLGVLGPRNLAGITRAMNDTAHRISHYLFLQLCTNSVVGTVITLGLVAIGVPYALLCGVLATALRFIPYIGIWVVAAIAVGLSIVLFPGWTQALLVLGLFVIVEAITGNAIEPLLFGHGTGVAPLPLLIAAVFWAWLWGPAGLLLSTPLTVCVVVLGRHIPALRFFDVLLGTRPALDPGTRYYQRLLAGDLREAASILQCLQQEQTLTTVCDEAVLPALVRASAERADDELNADEERSVTRLTRLLIHATLTPSAAEVTPPEPPSFRVLACPARDGTDGLALRLLALLVRQEGGELRVLSLRRLPGEIEQAATAGVPTVVCIGALPPDGQVQAAAVARQVHRSGPELKIVVGLWGQADDAGKANERLHALGATSVATTLHEAVDQIFAALGKPRPTAAKDHVASPTAACAKSA